MIIGLNNIPQNVSRLSQLAHFGLSADTAVTETMPYQFSTVLEASSTSEIMYQTMEGTMTPDTIIRMLMDQAMKEGIQFRDLAQELTDCIRRMSMTPQPIQSILSMFTGKHIKLVALRLSDISCAYPEELRTRIAAVFGKNTPPVVVDALTEILLPQLIALRWIKPTNPVTRVFSRLPGTPTLSNLIDTMYAYQLKQLLVDTMAVDFSGIINGSSSDLKLGEGKDVTNVTMNFVFHAIQRRYGAFFQNRRFATDPTKAVMSTLAVLARVWDPRPRTDDPLLSDSIVKSGQLVEFSSNLTMYLLLQELRTQKSDTVLSVSDIVCSFSPAEMASTIIPRFHEALTSLSPYRFTLISDSVAHLSIQSVYNDRRSPTHVYVMEHVDSSDSLDVIRSIRVDNTSPLRFIQRHTYLSDKMRSILNPVTTFFSLKDLISAEKTTLEMISPLDRMGSEGTVMRLVMLSHRERFADFGLGMPSEAQMLQALRGADVNAMFAPTDVMFTNAATSEETTRDESFVSSLVVRLMNEAVRDYFFKIMYLATASAGSTEINTVSDDSGLMGEFFNSTTSETGPQYIPPTLILSWATTVNTLIPISDSPIHGSYLKTLEPLELIAYVGDRANVTSLAAKDLPFDKFERSLHQWDWKERTARLNYQNVFSTTIHNTKVNVTVDSARLYSVHESIKDVFLLQNKMASAVASLWLDTFFAHVDELERLKQEATDPSEVDMYAHRVRSFGRSIVMIILSIGKTSAGEQVVDYIRRQVYEQLRGKQKVDSYNQLLLGAQRARLYLWTGVAILEATQLISGARLKQLEQWIQTQNLASDVVSELAFMENRMALMSTPQ